MKCPKCSHPMEKVTYENIEVDRCSSCGGIWFDMLEAEHLKSLEGSETIDVGDPEKGELYDEMVKIDCPVCHTRMIPMGDSGQSDIRFESCKVCYGVFFDAGEFKDFKRKTVLDFLGDLMAGDK